MEKDLFSDLEDLPPVPSRKPLLECLTSIVGLCRREMEREGRSPLVYYMYPKTVPSAIAPEATRLGMALGVSPERALLFSLILDMAEGSTLSRSDLAVGLGGGYVLSLAYEKDLEQLVDARLINRTSQGSVEVRQEVLKAIMDNKTFERPDFSNMSTFTILSRMARLFNETLGHERMVSEHFGKTVLYPYLDKEVMDVVGKIDMADLIPGDVRKENLRKVAENIGQPEVAAKKKKAAQYGSGAMNLFRKIAKRKVVTVNEMIMGMKDGQ